MWCGHANECPNICPCPEDCYCKGHSCQPKVEPNLADVHKNQMVSNLLQVLIGNGLDKIEYIRYCKNKIEISYDKLGEG